MNLEERKLKEIEHSDRRRQIVTGYEYYTDASVDQVKRGFVTSEDEYEYHFSNMKVYSITRSSFAYRDRLLFKNITGRTALDYCCGNGEMAVEMAKRGAGRVVGIDISKVAINNANRRARENGVEDRCEFLIMDAENTEFSENTFDIIHEYGALHHLELQASFKELSRIVKEDGRIVCTEALRHNPLIHLYRKRTPHLRTEWEVEHILGVPEIMGGLKHFEDIHIQFFHLAALSAVPFRKTLAFPRVLSFVEAADSFLLRIPYLQRLAWICVFVLSKRQTRLGRRLHE
jgi:ubiquinone/menaquinone biosynthesis C-methylase UbiE